MENFFDLDQIKRTDKFISASDEVGRGPLAGPVVACNVYYELKGKLKHKKLLEGLKEIGVGDSKGLDEEERAQVLSELGLTIPDLKIGKKLNPRDSRFSDIFFCLMEIGPREIEEINILNASLKGMHESFKKNYSKDFKGLVMIDGNRLPKKLVDGPRFEPIIKGDSKSLWIGLASIIAKQYRDNLMVQLGEKYPGYGLEKHAGYPTPFHREAIKTLGITPIHRRTFKGVKEFLEQ